MSPHQCPHWCQISTDIPSVWLQWRHSDMHLRKNEKKNCCPVQRYNRTILAKSKLFQSLFLTFWRKCDGKLQISNKFRCKIFETNAEKHIFVTIQSNVEWLSDNTYLPVELDGLPHPRGGWNIPLLLKLLKIHVPTLCTRRNSGFGVPEDHLLRVGVSYD